ncbi:MAG: hypothetical protein WCR86_11500 [Parabacteroides sp.]
MARSVLSPQQFASAKSLESRTVDVNGVSVTYILEKLVNGNAKIRVCWNQEQVAETGPGGDSYSVWNYDEWVLSWVPAPVFEKDSVSIQTMVTTTVEGSEVIDEATTKTNVADYIEVNAVEIFGYAKNACYLTKM